MDGEEIHKLLLDEIGIGEQVGVYVAERGVFAYSDDLIPPKGHGFGKSVSFRWTKGCDDPDCAKRRYKLTIRPIIHKKTGDVKAILVRLDYSYQYLYDPPYNSSHAWLIAPEPFNMILRRNPPLDSEGVPERFTYPYTTTFPATVNPKLFSELYKAWVRKVRGR